MTTIATNTTIHTNKSRFNIIKWFLDLDAAYRDAWKLENADERLLNDMGIKRDRSADQVFLSQLGANRWTPREY